MRLTKFLGRKCKVCMRILLLKSLFLGTNCASFLPILCGFLFVFAVDAFVYIPWNPFCFCRGFVLPWISFCCGCLCVYSFFLFVFVFSSLSFLLLSPTKSEKRGSFLGKSPSFFWKSPSFFWESPSFFWGYSLISNLYAPRATLWWVKRVCDPEQKGSATL